MKIEKCSCEETVFLRLELAKVVALCEDSTPAPRALAFVVETASEALGDPAPGGEPPCSCDEALHLRRALQACFNVAGADSTPGDSIDDLAQCNNFAHQGLHLQDISGDPGVYEVRDFIPPPPG